MPGAEPPSRRPVFLARASYRRRRLHDAARLVPYVAGFLWGLPLLWPRGETPLSLVLVYLFATWALSLVGAWLLARALRRAGPED
ncbi:hypothetical protein ACR03S_10360 [Limimaricola variabilis]|uniref:hypothetical protein n=1 Tax=Limimaricola variabilis TaxID=1492771 RepID=UPI001613B206|nr:hypothetical protein [Limimaricola variabilis]WPY95645.1 hypothetical protein T8T21_05865 [Limimaricola variabilis]